MDLAGYSYIYHLHVDTFLQITNQEIPIFEKGRFPSIIFVMEGFQTHF